MKREQFTSSRILGAVHLLAVCGMMAAAPVAAAAAYLGPVAVVASKDGKRLFVANADARQIAVVDVAGGKVASSIAMPAEPTGLVLGPGGTKLYVTCAAPKSTIVVLDTASGEKITSIPTGHTAVGPAISPDGKTLYVCNRFDNAVAVIDLATNKETARVATTREPIAAAITPDGKTLFVANHLPLDPADGFDVAAVVTVIDTASNKTTTFRLPNGSSSVRGICMSPDGKFAYITHILARYQMPLTQVERGWVNTNAMSVIDVGGKDLFNTVLLDDVDLGAANPWGVVFSADGASICVTHAGTHELSVIDAKKLSKKLPEMPDPGWDKPAWLPESEALQRAAQVPNNLAFLVGLRRRIRLQNERRWRKVVPPEEGGPWKLFDPTSGNGPRGLTIIGSKAYVASYFTDSLAVVDLIL